MLLKDLEANVGFTLFNRQNGRLVATPEALDLSDRIREALAGIDRLSIFAEDIREMRSGSLRIASLVGPSLTVIPQALAAFSERYPGVRTSFQTRSSGTVRDWAMADVLDIGIAESHTDLGYQVLHEFDLECYMALPSDHNLTKRADLGVQDISRERLLSLSPEHSTSTQLREAFAANSLKFAPTVETYIFGPLCGLVTAGAGVGLVDPLSAANYIGRGMTIRRFRPAIRFQLMMIAPGYRQPSRHAKEFAGFLKSSVDATVASCERMRLLR